MEARYSSAPVRSILTDYSGRVMEGIDMSGSRDSLTSRCRQTFVSLRYTAAAERQNR